MASSAADVLGPALRSGLVVAPVAGDVRQGFQIIVAEHPHPGDGSARAGREALAIARRLSESDLLLVLLSGGASALLAAPAEGLTLDDKRAATAALLKAGATIHQLNTVRKQLSAIKGGRLALATPAVTRTLVLSDVVGDDPSVIGSGPTVLDSATPADALAVLDRFGGRRQYPAAVVAHLEAALTAAPDLVSRQRVERRGDSVTIVGGRRDAMRGAAAEARSRGYSTHVLDAPVIGEARTAAAPLIEAAGRARQALPPPCCLIASGETTVTVTGNGKGGRNQELALASVPLIAGTADSLLFASVGTDGIDGPTEAAGAIVDETTRDRAAAAGLDPAEAFLEHNDAYRFFEPLGDLVITGPTGTNVGDLQVVLVP